MIHKEIQTNFSRTIHFAVWGKEETKELEGISKEELTPAIRNFVAKKLNTPSKKVFLLEQVHGDTFYDTKNLSTLSAEGDALYTTQRNEVLIVKTNMKSTHLGNITDSNQLRIGTRRQIK